MSQIACSDHNQDWNIASNLCTCTLQLYSLIVQLLLPLLPLLVIIYTPAIRTTFYPHLIKSRPITRISPIYNIKCAADSNKLVVNMLT